MRNIIVSESCVLLLIKPHNTNSTGSDNYNLFHTTNTTLWDLWDKKCCFWKKATSVIDRLCRSQRRLKDFHQSEMWYVTHVVEFLFFICPGLPLMLGQNWQYDKLLSACANIDHRGIKLIQRQTFIMTDSTVKNK